MSKIELSPIDGRKSFNGKCRVEEENGVSYLYSYDTKVAHFNHETGKMVVNGWYSITTARHINAFLNHFGFDSLSKKELMNFKN